jgi:hypothetical protein
LIEARGEIKTLLRQLETEREINSNMTEHYHELIAHNEGRFDELFQQHNKIVDSRLMLTRPVAQSDGPKEKQVKTRREPWAQVAARAEAKDRENYWKKKADSVDGKTLETKVDAATTDRK